MYRLSSFLTNSNSTPPMNIADHLQEALLLHSTQHLLGKYQVNSLVLLNHLIWHVWLYFLVKAVLLVTKN